MARFLKNRAQNKGKSPGTLTFIGHQKIEKSRIKVFKYNRDSVIEKDVKNIQEAIGMIEHGFVTWINIDGLHDVSITETIGNSLHVSPLVLEDILNTDHRPSLWVNETNISTIVKAINYEFEKNRIQEEQISFILGKHYLITLQEQVGTHFDSVRQRIKQSVGKTRQSGPDYLYYTLLDSLVDNYIVTLETLGTSIEQIDHKLKNAEKDTLAEIYHFKTEISYVRKLLRPMKEITIRLQKTDSDLLVPNTRSYINDLDELTTQTVESIDFYHMMITDQLHIYQATTSQQQNEIMKVLTVFTSIFIPLTFITGIYGTNFDYLPELRFHYSYFILWGVFCIVAISMLLFYKKKKWI